jgi:hypothetical protein
LERWKEHCQAAAKCRDEIAACKRLNEAGKLSSDLLAALTARFAGIEALLGEGSFENQIKEIQDKLDELIVDFCVDMNSHQEGGKGVVFEVLGELGKQCRVVYFDNNPAVKSSSSVLRVSDLFGSTCMQLLLLIDFVLYDFRPRRLCRSTPTKNLEISPVCLQRLKLACWVACS